jgi:prepilin-type N-terminal cleavage/methylation domain-containing protein
MVEKQRRLRAAAAAAGFTLIELMVVIGIIVLLVSILVPVVSKVRTASYEASTSQQLIALQNGIENYHQANGAYPGPLPDDEVMPNGPPVAKGAVSQNTIGKITSSENLVFGLLGGIQATVNPANLSVQLTYSANLVGKGPQSLSPLKSQTYGTYVDPTSSGLDTTRDGLGNWFPWSNGAHQYTSAASPPYTDNAAPEFVDRFPDGMPILYVRARAGATLVVTDGASKTYPNGPPSASPAYNMAQLTPYTFATLPFPTTAPPWPTPPAPYQLYAPQYFGTPAPDYLGPRHKDAYLLISAGRDRKYGTSDDLLNGGRVQQ